MPGAPTAEQMEAFMKLAAPGEQHKKLEPLVGTFDAAVRVWFGPGAPPSQAGGTLTTRWVLGGRFLLMEYQGRDALGGAMEGLGLLGYDNRQGCYVGTWADTMSTMLFPVGKGQMQGKTITTLREMPDCTSGGTMAMRDVTTLVSRDEHRYAMFMTPQGGQEFQTLEVVYTRRR